MGFIFESINGSVILTEKDLFLSSPCAKAYWLDKESFLLIDELLFHERENDSEKDLVIPHDFKTEAILLNHDLHGQKHE